MHLMRLGRERNESNHCTTEEGLTNRLEADTSVANATLCNRRPFEWDALQLDGAVHRRETCTHLCLLDVLRRQHVLGSVPGCDNAVGKTIRTTLNEKRAVRGMHAATLSDARGEIKVSCDVM